MKRCGIMLAGLAGCLAVVTTTEALTDNPYQKIVDRNAFGLRAPPPPPDPETLKTPPPKITLQGITTIGDRNQVLFKCQAPPVPGQPAKDQSYMLGEGEREDDIEVLNIDEKGGLVKVNNHGVAQTLDMKSDAVKPSGGGGPGPGGVPRPTLPMPTPPGGMPGGGDPMRRIPQRSVRTSSMDGGSGNNAPSLNGNNANNGYLGSPSGSAQSGPQVPQLTSEEQAIMIEVERERTKAAVANGDMPPLPATEITPPGSIGIQDPPPATDNTSGSGQTTAPNPH